MDRNLRPELAQYPLPSFSDHSYDDSKLDGSTSLDEQTCRRTQHRNCSIPDSWLIEAISMGASLFCQGALIAILVSMHNKPLANWKAPISMNATISILTTASKSLLLLSVAECISQSKWAHFQRPRRMFDFDTFDSASRGPLGSIQLLIGKQNFRSLASIGAVITLLALAVDPFAQQVLVFPQRPVSMGHGTASFGYSDIYDNGGMEGADGGPILTVQDNPMHGAVMSGLYGLNVSTAFGCETSNCRWPGTYYTLGFDSTCKNVTTQVTRRCNTTSDTENCNITTPGDVALHSDWYFTNELTAIDISTAEPKYNCSRAGIITETCVGDVLTLMTFAVYRMYAPDTTSFALTNSWWEVLECSLSPVAYNYANVSVQDNRFSIGSAQKSSLIRISDEDNDGGTHDVISSSQMHFTTSNASHNFSININDWETLKTFLATKIFSGSITMGFTGTNETGLGPSALSSANITDIANNIALSMTNRVRTGRNMTLAQGEAFRDDLFVSVQWPWLSLPIFTVLASGVFLLATAVQTRRHGIDLWKSSSVALLAHQIEGWDKHDVEFVRGQEQLLKQSKGVKLKLRDDRYLRLIKS